MSEAGGSNRGFRKKRHQNEGSEDTINAKKPFNKKKWREGHYSFKSKLDQHSEYRKKSVIRNYHKLLLKEDKTAAHPATRLNRPTKEPKVIDLKQRRYRELEEAKAEFQEKLVKMKEEHAAAREARSKNCDAVAESRKRRTERFKKVSAKTKNGQPVMRGRLELMLQEIEQKVKGGSW